MTMQRVAGHPFPLSALWYTPHGGSASVFRWYPVHGGATIDASAEKVAHAGYVQWSDGGTHTISSSGGKIMWVGGAVTFATAGSTIRAGIQGVDAANAQRPDGSFTTYDDLVQGTDTITANGLNTVTLSSGTDSIATGAMRAVVFDFTTRNGADSVVVASTFSNSGGTFLNGMPWATNYTTSWQQPREVPDILLQADDGTYGWFLGAPFISAVSAQRATVSFNSGTAGYDEYGAMFQVASKIGAIGFSLPVTTASSLSADFTLSLYTDPLGTPALVGSTAIDMHQWGNTGDRRGYAYLPYTLQPGVTYGLTARPTTANSVTVDYLDWGSGNDWAKRALPFGATASLIKRIDNSGAFTEVNYQLPPFAIMVSELSDDAGGGTVIAGTPMRRGMV